jgi:hypothetical protein
MADNFRQYVGKLLAGVRWARAPWGQRLTVGLFGLFSDLNAEGARQANRARLTDGSHDDALGEIGRTRDIERYTNDSPATYRGRLARAFEIHAEDGTRQAVEKALAEFGFPSARVYEDWQWHRPPQPWWSQGWILFPAGSHGVSRTTQTYGDGSNYGEPGKLYGLTGITAGEIDGLRRLVKRRKRAAFIFRSLIFANGSTYGTGVLYGGGATYSAPISQALAGAE